MSLGPPTTEKLVVEDQVEIAVQVSGKIKVRIMVLADANEEAVKALALEQDRVQHALAG